MIVLWYKLIGRVLTCLTCGVLGSLLSIHRHSQWPKTHECLLISYFKKQINMYSTPVFVWGRKDMEECIFGFILAYWFTPVLLVPRRLGQKYPEFEANLHIEKHLFFFKCFFELMFLFIIGCPGIYSVEQVGLELRQLPVSASQTLVLKECTITTWLRSPFQLRGRQGRNCFSMH